MKLIEKAKTTECDQGVEQEEDSEEVEVIYNLLGFVGVAMWEVGAHRES